MAKIMSLVLLLRTIMILTFSAWIFLWFLKPTRSWTRKWKEAEGHMQSTIFKYNGADFMVYTFPMIALAMFGLVYSNLQPWKSSRRVRRHMTALCNPLIIRTPIGILSGIEALGVCLLLILLVWTFYTRISNDYRKLVSSKPMKNIWQLKFLKIATRCGLLSEICLSLLLFPILRSLSILKLLGTQFQASVRYHMWLGTVVFFFAALHGAGILFIWGTNSRIQNEMWKSQKERQTYFTGVITLITGLVIWASSLPIVRRKRFDVFYYMHHLYIVFLVLFLFHAGDRHFYMVFSGVFLFGLDKLLRLIQSSLCTQILSARMYPGKVIELTLPKDSRLEYTPTSILFIKIPCISKFHWHPFSITSSSSANDGSISVMIKCEGQWTNSVYNLLHQEIDSHSPNRTKCIDVAVEGPYGPASFDFIRYDGLLLIGGGIGITPILSILQEIASVTKTGLKTRLPSEIQLVFVTKKSQDISLLSPVSNLILNQPSRLCNFKLRAFVTQETTGVSDVKQLLNEFSALQSIVFELKKPGCVLGPGNPLWMAAMTGFGSLVFVLCQCVFNHFLFQPGKKTSRDSVPSMSIDLLLLCSFLIALGFVAVVVIVLRQRSSREAMTLIVDRREQEKELGSMERPSTPEEHEIHYGARPNFQDILSQMEREFGGSNVGVVVCGPESMKESVAIACQQKCQALKLGAKKQQPDFAFRALNFTL